MRALSALALLAVLGACGAVIATRMAAPDGSTGAAVAGTVSPAAADRPHVSPAPAVISHGAPVRITVRAADGRRVLTSTVGRLDPRPAAGGGYAPIDPPAWNQAVWVSYRPLVSPADTAHGTSYVYGHACHHHVCSFTNLAEVRPGASVVVTAGQTSTRYTVTTASADFPKSGPGSLADRTSGVADRTIAHRIVLITCAYGHGDVSVDNFVVVAVRR
jgi:hypothetical protein